MLLAAGLVPPVVLAVAVSSAVARKPEAAVVVARDGDLWIGKTRVTGGAAEDTHPDWSPDRRRIVFSRQPPSGRGSEIWVVRRDGGGLRRLTRGFVDVQPAWAPDGRRIAFARSPVSGGSFDVFVVASRGGTPRLLAGGEAEQLAPAWSREGALQVKLLQPGMPFSEKSSDSGTPALGPRELLPDFDQRAPRGLVVSVIGGRWTLGFDSAVDNVGQGPARFRSHRSPGERTMQADQIVHLSDGSTRVYPDVGRNRYVIAPPHRHWHVLDFDRYELRRPDDYSLVVRDRKTGFCLADHYGYAARRVAGFSGPRFLGNCGQGEPELLSVEQGTSIGYTDRYPANFHGQNVDLTGVPAGDYILVHRANPEELLEELDYTNNAASLRVRLSWDGSVPDVDTLRVCEGSERC